MNPFTWKREHQIALLLAVILGAALGSVLGYLAFAAAQGASGAPSFDWWMWARWPYTNSTKSGGFWWMIFGGIAGGAFLYVYRLMREP